jgi:hypothetical protein
MHWFSSDSEQNWQKNKRENPLVLQHLGWTDQSVINYNINNEGFRTDNFDEPRDVLWIGCSSTFGVGINESDTFAHRVSKEMGWSYYNLSRPAIGWEFYYRMLHRFIDTIDPKYVFVVDPSTLGRREILCDDGRNVAITKPQPRGTGKMVLSYEPKELLDSRELDIMRMRSMDAIRWVCRNTKLVFLGDITNSYQTHSARDLIHPGVEDNTNMSKVVLDILSDLMYYK